jgi:hypothetical protein
MGAGGNHPIRCSSKRYVLEQLQATNEPNASIAWDELVRDNYIEAVDKNYFTINFDKRADLMILATQDSELELAKAQPLESDFADLDYRFASGGEWKYSNKSYFHFCVKQDDPTYWIVLVKNKGVGKPGRLHVGSTQNQQSRLSRIWAATKKAADQSTDKTFIQHDAEALNLKACGTGRRISRAAFEIFREYGLIRAVGKRRRGTLYMLTGKDLTDIDAGNTVV